MIIPYRVDVPMDRWPVANWVLLGLTVGAFGVAAVADTETLRPFVLGGGSFLGLVGHLFLHAGLLHLAGNLLFLWVFGNAVCAKVGNALYPVLYLALGVLAGATHLLFSDHPALGASGAINGIVGMYLVLFPLNEVSCVAWLLGPRWFSLSSFWMILLWLVYDVWGAFAGGGNTAYAAHLGGFAAGFGAAFLMCWKGWVVPERHEKTLLQIWGIGSSSTEETAPVPVPVALPRPAPPASAPEAIPLVCACGKRLRVPARLIGKRVKCPACGSVLTVQGSD